MNVCLNIFIFAALFPKWTDCYVQVKPNSGILKVFGETFVSFCNYTGTNAEWYYGNDTQPYHQGKPISETTSRITLEISEVDFGDQGIYSCKDVESQDSVTLLVYKKPTFPNLKQNQNLTFGQNGKIECQVNSVNETVYEWKLNKVPIQQSERVRIQEGEYLEIENVEKSDEGVYTCRATVNINDRYYEVSDKLIHVDVTEIVTEKAHTASNGQGEAIDDIQTNNGSQGYKPLNASLLCCILALMIMV